MSDQFLAEIRVVGFNFPPTGWAECAGQLLPISQNTALFALLGTVYGGDGKTTFALPDMQGNAPMQPGQGQGLSLRDLGEIGGSQTVTLLNSEIPVHTHTMQASGFPASTNIPLNSPSIARSAGGNAYDAPSPTPLGTAVQMAPETLTPAGGSLPHNNLMPYLTLNYVIALQGIFPQRP
jgi:microcystin-dependent protein